MLRTALSLSAITGDNFRMENIRGNRSNPGLKRQHLEAVRAAARLCDAKLEGAELGSETLEFKPGALRNESFTVNIGTAGSVTLLLDTVLPVTTQFSEAFRLDVKGGTDVKWSPAVEYLRRVKLELLKRSGMKASLELKRTGFYPAGNGEVRLETENYSMKPLELVDRGELERFEICSKASEELERQNVADRQADELARKLKNSSVSRPVRKDVEYVDTDSTGSSLVLKAVYTDSIAGFDTLGERGKRSEEVAKEVYQGFRRFHASEAAVDPYMADQLMVYLALIGGEVAVPEITPHVQTNLYVLEKFGKPLEFEKAEKTLIRG